MNTLRLPIRKLIQTEVIVITLAPEHLGDIQYNAESHRRMRELLK